MEAALNCDDILIDILLRVPVKPLIRLKCVSKHWLNLISSPSFGSHHAGQMSASGFYFYTAPDDRLYSVPLHAHQTLPTFSFIEKAVTDIVDRYKFYILDTRCGLFLCSHKNKSRLLYSVANPTTKKYKFIPQPPPSKIQNDFFTFTCLAFNPTSSLHYKVVILRHDHTRYNEIDTYSSEDDSWRRGYVGRGLCDCKLLTPRVFWDGAVHWLNHNNTHLKFNVHTMKLMQNSLPRKASSHLGFHYLGECGGELLLVEHGVDYTRGYIIHEMRRGTCYWRLKHLVHIRVGDHYLSQPNTTLHVLSVLKKSHTSDVLLVFAHGGRVYAYNTKMNTMEMLNGFYGRREYTYGFVRHYIESLFPV